jgi:hypothetical protein
VKDEDVGEERTAGAMRSSQVGVSAWGYPEIVVETIQTPYMNTI